MLEKKYFNTEKPNNNQTIIIKEIGAYYLKVGKYQITHDNKEQIYIPDCYIIEDLDTIDWWCEIPE